MRHAEIIAEGALKRSRPRTPAKFARMLIETGLRKYHELPDHRAAATRHILINAVRLARPFIGDAAIHGLVAQALAEQPMSVVEAID